MNGSQVDRGSFRQTTAGMRAILWVGAVLVTAAGSQLYLLSAQTDRYFAWTIKLPLTAAFLGGFYFTALGFAILSARQPEWSRARVGVPGVAAFLWLTLLASLLHLGLFHLTSGPGSARVAAWLWLVIYVVDPSALTLLSFLQTRAPGRDRARARPLPGWYRWLLGIEFVVIVAVGAALFVAPSTAAHLWPWALTPLTARVSAAWLMGFGIVLATMIVENDWDRVRPALGPSVVLVALQAVALARYPHAVDWTSLPAFVYLIMLAGVLVLGAAGMLLARAPVAVSRLTDSTTLD